MGDVLTIHLETRGVRIRPFGRPDKVADMPMGEKCFLMQYTGLRDKQGTEIFGGDIVAFFDPDGNKETGEVVYGKQNAAFCFHLSHVSTGISVPILNFITGIMTVAASNNFKVIGNIYENPELIQEVKQ